MDSLRWRWQAFRTGKSFAEIVLLETLEYRTEQLFLIEPGSGLLMQHVAVDASVGRDPAQVAAMLEAICGFVADSFRASGESLQTIAVGELSVCVERGPRALLAAVARGRIAQDDRMRLIETLEAIHLQYAERLESFDGNPDSLSDLRPLLESCLVTRYRPRRQPRARSS